MKQGIQAGKPQRAIAEELGLSGSEVVKELLKRERRKERRGRALRARKPAKTLQEYKVENKRLKMEAEFQSHEAAAHILCGGAP